jgi:serine/threonine protein phosphatase 1
MQSTKEDSSRRAEVNVQIVFLGDLVDRGLDSRDVIELVISLHASGQVHLIKGNHEELFVAVSRGDRDAARQFFGVGGRETLLSYRFGEDDVDRSGKKDTVSGVIGVQKRPLISVVQGCSLGVCQAAKSGC